MPPGVPAMDSSFLDQDFTVLDTTRAAIRQKQRLNGLGHISGAPMVLWRGERGN